MPRDSQRWHRTDTQISTTFRDTPKKQHLPHLRELGGRKGSHSQHQECHLCHTRVERTWNDTSWKLWVHKRPHTREIIPILKQIHPLIHGIKHSGSCEGTRDSTWEKSFPFLSNPFLSHKEFHRAPKPEQSFAAGMFWFLVFCISSLLLQIIIPTIQNQISFFSPKLKLKCAPNVWFSCTGAAGMCCPGFLLPLLRKIIFPVWEPFQF